MAESNGELQLAAEVSATKSEDRGDGERTEDYSKLLEYGLDKKVREIVKRITFLNPTNYNLISGGRKIG